MSRFTKPLLVSPMADGRTWVIRADFGYDVGEEGSGVTIDVPIGFMTDFASVPRVLWWLIPRWGRYGNAAVIHDYCYWERRESRRWADDVFLEAMQVLRVGVATRWAIYFSVRTFGWWAWRRGQRLTRRGGTRIAAALPAKAVELPKTYRGL